MRERWPTAGECLDLLARHGAPSILMEHCASVRGLALVLARRARERGHAVDERVVGAAALLHDIGRTVTMGPQHGLAGANLLRKQGLPDAVCLAVERHVGAGLDAGDAKGLGMPAKDYLPRSLEEKIVCHADNLWNVDRRSTLEEECKGLEAKGLHKAVPRMRALHAEIAELVGEDPETIPW